VTVTEFVAVVVTIVAVVAAAAIVVLVWMLGRAVAQVRAAALRLAEVADATAAEVRRLTSEAHSGLARADGLIERADSISATLEDASRLTYLAVANPVIKAAAVASGVRRGAGRFGRLRAPREARSGRRLVPTGARRSGLRSDRRTGDR
jgi:hypothetical protein